MSAQTKMLVEHVDRYRSASSAGNSGIFLAASTTGTSAAPFFRGYLTAPRRGADFALTLAHVVETRFYTPPGMIQRLILQRDPVITCSNGMLRLEGFSVCCGVYARLDLKSEAFDADRLETGTSNVDFNPPMRAALARLQDSERVRLEVSASGFTLVPESSGPAFERRVTLPLRWVKGFVEVQAHQFRMKSRFQISGVMAQRFLRELPRNRTRGPVWVKPVGGSLRLSHAPSSEGVQAGGIDRLKMLAPVARHATMLEVFAGGDGATAWRLEFPEGRFFLVLSPEPSRGFSGEGQVLENLAASSTITSRLRALLRWQKNLVPRALAEELRTTEAETVAALAELGACGLVGYDLAESAFFHRELPFDVSRISRLHPRLAGAHSLAREGSVELDAAGAWVRGRKAEYRIRRDPDGQWHCSCPWTGRHGTTRGPCKHILAVQLATGGNAANDDSV
jgi:hypothetical protein